MAGIHYGVRRRRETARYEQVPVRRTGSSRSLRPALLLIGVLGLAIGAGEVPLIVGSFGAMGWLVACQCVCGVVYVSVGVIAWDRRPSNFTGALLCVAGFVSLGASLVNVPNGALELVGSVLAEAPIAVALHLLMAFPGGRLQGRFDRFLVVAGYLVTVGLQIPRYLLRDSHGTHAVQSVLGSLILLMATGLLVHRWRTSPAVAGERRARAWVYTYGGLAILFLPVSAQLLRPWWGLSPIALFVMQVTALTGVPFVFAAGLLVGGFARTGQIEELAAWLGSQEDSRKSLRLALADTLGDDSLQLLFRRGDSDELFDSKGQRATVGSGRGSIGQVPVDVRGAPSALILYDTSLVSNPALVESAGRVVALALERERLTAELMVERAALRESRTRLVEAVDQERRRFARDLHDLLQSRLVLAAMHAGSLAVAPQTNVTTTAAAHRLRLELESAIVELRHLVHGVLPALLLERGFFAAVEDLVDRLDVPADLELEEIDEPIPAAVSSNAYFIVAEALANAVKHAAASRLRVSIVQTTGWLLVVVSDDGVGGARGTGSGLQGMADRVEALNGNMTLTSPPGQGTRIQVRLPCDSDVRTAEQPTPDLPPAVLVTATGSAPRPVPVGDRQR